MTELSVLSLAIAIGSLAIFLGVSVLVFLVVLKIEDKVRLIKFRGINMNKKIKVITSLILLIFSSIPTFLGICVYNILVPVLFWEKIVLLGTLLFFVSGIQICLFVFVIGILFHLWSEI